jgi:gas vesicle protein
MATKATSPATKTTSRATKTTSTKKARPAATKRGPAAKGPQRMPTDIAKADAGLRKAAKQLGDAVAELRASEDKAWKDYSDDVHEALLHLNAQLEVATAQVKAAHSETREDLADALHQAAGARKGIVDQLRVQTRLGMMEARDRSQEAIDNVNAIGRRLESVIDAVRHDTKKAWDDLYRDTTDTISHLREAIQAVGG